MIQQIVRTMPKVKDGEPFRVARNGSKAEFVHRCCECGMRHDVNVNIGNRNLVFRFYRLRKERTPTP